MSLTEISVRVAIVTVFALGALVAIGWRPPAPHYPRPPKARVAQQQDSLRLETSTADAPDNRDLQMIGRSTTRKVFDVLGLGSIAAFVGILVALITASAIAWMVTALINRL